MKNPFLILLIVLVGLNLKGYSQNFGLNHQPFSSPQLNYKSTFNQNSFSLALPFNTEETKKVKWYNTGEGRSYLVSGALIGFGLYTYKDEGPLNRKTVKDEINRYLPNFEYHLDDYIQFVPYIAYYALDMVGIESKHTTRRKTSSLLIAGGLTMLTVQGLKYTVQEPRPDGSANNSFPSGHTATAFMGAHLFQKEYGHRSPFYSIGAYILATTTGVLRQLNDRHWISDVAVGAGLGISMTELAYLINKKIYGDREINEYVKHERIINESKPSFIAIKAGYASLTEAKSNEEPGISSEGGYRLSTEGAYFFNKYIGIGAEIGFQSFENKIDNDVEQLFNNLGYDIILQSAGNRMYYGGIYLQMPFGKNSIGTKCIAGSISGPNTNIFIRDQTTTSNETPQELVYAQYSPYTTFSWATGAYYKRILSKNVSLSLFYDYNIADAKYDVTYIDNITQSGVIYTPTETKTVLYDSYAIGLSLDVMLW